MTETSPRYGARTAGANAAPIPREWLAAIFVLALLMRLASWTGLIGSDDLGYIGFATQISQGTYTPFLHHYAVRYGLIGPVGAVYAMFGISEWTSIVLPLLSSALSVVLIALIGARLFDRNAGVLAALMYAAFPLQLHYATILVPEGVAECYVLTAVLLHVRNDSRAPLVLGTIAGILIGVAYLTKEPAIFVAPPLFLDAVINRRWRHAAALALGTSVILAGEVSYYYATTGDPAFRQHAMALHNFNMATNPHEIIVDVNYRLFKKYPRWMLVPNLDFGVHSVVAISLAAVAILRGFRRDARTWFLTLWIVVPWLYINFGSSSLSQYIILPAAPRYLEFTYPPLFLGAAWLMSTFSTRSAYVRPIQATVGSMMLVGFACALATKGTGYNTAEVASLRAISARAGLASGGCARVAAPPTQTENWTTVLRVLNGKEALVCGGDRQVTTIAPDSWSLPYASPEFNGGVSLTSGGQQE